MKKIFLSLISVLLVVSLLTGCSTSTATDDTSSEADSVTTEDATDDTTEEVSDDTSEETASTELNLFTWEGMFPQELLDQFEEETGITVNYSNFDTDETMLAKLEAAEGGDYDLVIADDYIIETAIAQGLVQELDTTLLSNYENINPLYQGQFYDPDDAYTVPYGAGVMTIVYDPSLTNVEITSYEDLWDTSLLNDIGIISNYRVINGMALKILGESYNTEDLDVISDAGDLLLELAPNIRVISDSNLQDQLVSGEVSVAVMYTSQVTMAKIANPDLEVVYPEEGIGFGIIAQFIPSDAPHSDAAYAFIDFLLEAENAASGFEWLGYYSTNQAADALIAEEYQDFLTLPEEFTTDDMEMIQNISAEADEAHYQAWTLFKTAAE